MARFRKKPVEIEALPVQEVLSHLFGNAVEWSDWAQKAIDEGVVQVHADRSDQIDVVTAEGTMLGDTGDWLIRGVKGELYPCKPDIFEATYESVESPRADFTQRGLWISISGAAELKRLEDGEAVLVDSYYVQKAPEDWREEDPVPEGERKDGDEPTLPDTPEEAWRGLPPAEGTRRWHILQVLKLDSGLPREECLALADSIEIALRSAAEQPEAS